MKARTPHEVARFQDIPNIGPAMTKDLALIGILMPTDLIGKDPYELYKRLCNETNMRHDPCVLDTFMAVVDFMNGAPANPWWFYTTLRKQKYPEI